MDFAEANHALTRWNAAEDDSDDERRRAGNARPVEVEFRRAMRSALMPRSSSAGRTTRRRSNGDSETQRAHSLSPPVNPTTTTTATAERPASRGRNSRSDFDGAQDDDDVPIFRFGSSFALNDSPATQSRRRRDSGGGADSFERFRSALDVLADPADDGNASWAATRTAALARPVPTKPSRILDAPDIVDDYYLNLLSWSSTNVLAVALATNVYLWNAATNEVSELLQLDQGDCVTSVAWAPGGQHLCVGTDSHVVQLWDTTRMQLLRTMRGHAARVGSLAWNPVSRCVNSGSRDALVLQHDARAHRHCVATLRGHQQEVCGLAWSADGSTLASGGNENFLCLWEAARSAVGAHGHQSRSRTPSTSSSPEGRGGESTETTTTTTTTPEASQTGASVAPRVVLRQHQAAVKALAWCPSHRNLLASGGGTADRTVKFWNAHTGALLNSVDTGSQVCALLWSRHTKEIVSSHGFSQNQLCLWRYPSMTKLCELTGHTARVLHLAQSPDGETVVSAAADETLRFWTIFGPSVTGNTAGRKSNSSGTANSLFANGSPSRILGSSWRNGGDGLSIR